MKYHKLREFDHLNKNKKLMYKLDLIVCTNIKT